MLNIPVHVHIEPFIGRREDYYAILVDFVSFSFSSLNGSGSGSLTAIVTKESGSFEQVPLHDIRGKQELLKELFNK